MRIAVTTTQVPFVMGGAELSTNELTRALRAFGHQVEIVTMPFRFHPKPAVARGIELWAGEHFDRFDCGPIDRVLCLKFPTYYLHHPNKCVWLMHQHRAVYELYGTTYGESADDAVAASLRDEIIRRDTESLASAKAVYTTSNRVTARLLEYNGVKSRPLYQPTPLTGKLYEGGQFPYVFFPSRIEALKRQELLIRAVPHLKSPVGVVIAGKGGLEEQMKRLAGELGVASRVRFVGHVEGDPLISLYANALSVFFGPYDEDYGFITLEAMQASKPVITCTDSGAPLEFVVHGETGLVVDPQPEAVAQAIDELYANRSRARDLGRAGLAHYESFDISWESVVGHLLS